MQFFPPQLNGRLRSELAKRGWQDSRRSDRAASDMTFIQSTACGEKINAEPRRQIESLGQVTVSSSDHVNMIKDRISLGTRFGAYASVTYAVFEKHIALYIGDMIDVGIEILPMKEMQGQMSSGISYYEGELYNVIRQGRGVPAVPLVLVGIAP